MRIGILTLHSQLNYGGVLQAFALQEALRQKGYSVVVLDKKMLQGDIALYLGEAKLSWRQRCGKYIRTMLGMQPDNLFRRGRKTREFLHKYLNLSKHSFYTWNDISPNSLAVECLLVGSDQVWHYWENRPSDLDVFLLKGISKVSAISYAASIGMSKLPLDTINHFKEGLSKFSGISVRETEAVKQLAEIGFQATHVVDPTLLLQSTFWQSMTHWQTKRKKRLFCYFMTDNWVTVFPAIQKYAEKMDCPIDVFFTDTLSQCPLPSNLKHIMAWLKWLNALHNHDARIVLHFDASPDEFLQCASMATDAVSDSFHALMFSIIFRLNVRILRPKDITRQTMFSRIEEFTEYTTSGTLISDGLDDALRSISEDEPVVFDEDKIARWQKFSFEWLKKQLFEIENELCN